MKMVLLRDQKAERERYTQTLIVFGYTIKPVLEHMKELLEEQEGNGREKKDEQEG